MSDTTDIEKKSLEAHVELCAERYRFLENKLEHVDNKITAVESMLKNLHDMVHDLGHQRNSQIINWGLGIMAIMLGIIGYLLAVFVVK
jgi:septation ring formation regulator EzrA